MRWKSRCILWTTALILAWIAYSTASRVNYRRLPWDTRHRSHGRFKNHPFTPRRQHSQIEDREAGNVPVYIDNDEWRHEQRLQASKANPITENEIEDRVGGRDSMASSIHHFQTHARDRRANHIDHRMNRNYHNFLANERKSHLKPSSYSHQDDDSESKYDKSFVMSDTQARQTPWKNYRPMYAEDRANKDLHYDKHGATGDLPNSLASDRQLYQNHRARRHFQYGEHETSKDPSSMLTTHQNLQQIHQARRDYNSRDATQDLPDSLDIDRHLHQKKEARRQSPNEKYGGMQDLPESLGADQQLHQIHGAKLQSNYKKQEVNKGFPDSLDADRQIPQMQEVRRQSHYEKHGATQNLPNSQGADRELHQMHGTKGRSHYEKHAGTIDIHDSLASGRQKHEARRQFYDDGHATTEDRSDTLATDPKLSMHRIGHQSHYDKTEFPEAFTNSLDFERLHRYKRKTSHLPRYHGDKTIDGDPDSQAFDPQVPQRRMNSHRSYHDEQLINEDLGDSLISDKLLHNQRPDRRLHQTDRIAHNPHYGVYGTTEHILNSQTSDRKLHHKTKSSDQSHYDRGETTTDVQNPPIRDQKLPHKYRNDRQFHFKKNKMTNNHETMTSEGNLYKNSKAHSQFQPGKDGIPKDLPVSDFMAYDRNYPTNSKMNHYKNPWARQQWHRGGEINEDLDNTQTVDRKFKDSPLTSYQSDRSGYEVSEKLDNTQAIDRQFKKTPKTSYQFHHSDDGATKELSNIQAVEKQFKEAPKTSYPSDRSGSPTTEELDKVKIVDRQFKDTSGISYQSDKNENGKLLDNIQAADRQFKEEPKTSRQSHHQDGEKNEDIFDTLVSGRQLREALKTGHPSHNGGAETTQELDDILMHDRQFQKENKMSQPSYYGGAETTEGFTDNLASSRHFTDKRKISLESNFGSSEANANEDLDTLISDRNFQEEPMANHQYGGGKTTDDITDSLASDRQLKGERTIRHHFHPGGDQMNEDLPDTLSDQLVTPRFSHRSYYDWGKNAKDRSDTRVYNQMFKKADSIPSYRSHHFGGFPTDLLHLKSSDRQLQKSHTTSDQSHSSGSEMNEKLPVILDFDQQLQQEPMSKTNHQTNFGEEETKDAIRNILASDGQFQQTPRANHEFKNDGAGLKTDLPDNLVSDVPKIKISHDSYYGGKGWERPNTVVKRSINRQHGRSEDKLDDNIFKHTEEFWPEDRTSETSDLTSKEESLSDMLDTEMTHREFNNFLLNLGDRNIKLIGDRNSEDDREASHADFKKVSQITANQQEKEMLPSSVAVKDLIQENGIPTHVRKNEDLSQVAAFSQKAQDNSNIHGVTENNPKVLELLQSAYDIHNRLLHEGIIENEHSFDVLQTENKLKLADLLSADDYNKWLELSDIVRNTHLPKGRELDKGRNEYHHDGTKPDTADPALKGSEKLDSDRIDEKASRSVIRGLRGAISEPFHTNGDEQTEGYFVHDKKDSSKEDNSEQNEIIDISNPTHMLVNEAENTNINEQEGSNNEANFRSSIDQIPEDLEDPINIKSAQIYSPSAINQDVSESYGDEDRGIDISSIQWIIYQIKRLVALYIKLQNDIIYEMSDVPIKASDYKFVLQNDPNLFTSTNLLSPATYYAREGYGVRLPNYSDVPTYQRWKG